MPEEGEYYKVAVNVDRGDGSKLGDLLHERDSLRHQLGCAQRTAEDRLQKIIMLDELMDAVKPFIMAKPIPAVIPPEQVLFRFGGVDVYLRDLLKLRLQYWKIKTP